MLKLPVGELIGNNLDLGTLEASDKDSLEFSSNSTDTAITNNFSLSATELTQLARTDGNLRSIKNLYLNYNQAIGALVVIAPCFRWNPGRIPSITSAYFDPALMASASKQYYFYIQGNPDLMLDSAQMSLVAPGPVFAKNLDPSAAPTPLGTTIGPEYFCPSTSSPYHVYEYLYFVGAIPSGFWTLKENNQAKAIFDLGCAYEEDSAGYPKICIPSPRIAINSDSIVTGLDIKWYIYTENGYEQLTDMTVLQKILTGQVMLGFNNFTHGISEYDYPEVGTISKTAFTKSWAVGHTRPTGSYNLDELVIDYQMNGLAYRFNFSADTSLYGQ
jgi:hypothetical protein